LTFANLKSAIQKFVPELMSADIGTFINIRYQQLLKNWQWSFLKGYKNLALVAPYGTGTVSVTNGSTTVTGSGTSWTSGMAGRHFRLSNAIPFYKIASVTDATHLELFSAYGSNDAAGQAYTIFQHIYSLASDCREIIKIVYDFPMQEKSVEWIERNDPDRSLNGKPLYWTDRGLDSSNYRQIEVYPMPDDNYVIRYSYWKIITDLSANADTPLIRDDLLIEASLIDCYRIAVNKNPNYVSLIATAAASCQKLWVDAVEEDMRKSSAEMEVRDYGEEGRLGDDFFVDHWEGGRTF